MFHQNSTEGAYATLFFAEYCDHSRRLRYANCGHLPALVLRGNGPVERLDSTSTVLGLFSDWDCEIAECRLFAGDSLVLYTDGITESFTDAEEDFAERRLIEACRRHSDLSPESLIAAVVAEVRQFTPGEQQDDITLIVAKAR
jgi:serine phosphatase RsbU (regulator of sigma subunit)